MDFPIARPIIDAMVEWNKNGIFGYTSRPDSYFESVRDWQAKRNGWTFDTALASFCPGVVPALAAIVDRFSNKGDDIGSVEGDCVREYGGIYQVSLQDGKKILR